MARCSTRMHRPANRPHPNKCMWTPASTTPARQPASPNLPHTHTPGHHHAGPSMHHCSLPRQGRVGESASERLRGGCPVGASSLALPHAGRHPPTAAFRPRAATLCPLLSGSITCACPTTHTQAQVSYVPDELHTIFVCIRNAAGHAKGQVHLRGGAWLAHLCLGVLACSAMLSL